MEVPEKIYLVRTIGGIDEWRKEPSQYLRHNIEYVRTDASIRRACQCYCDNICEKGMSGKCFHKHDGEGQVKNTFQYNECNELKLLINAIKG